LQAHKISQVQIVSSHAIAADTPGRHWRPVPYPGNDLRFLGAGEGIRTLDPNLGKVVLYP
jgi:hypothetical protein